MAEYLAAATSEEELLALKEWLAQKMEKGEKALIVFHSLIDFPIANFGEASEQIALARPADFLGRREFDEINEKAGLFASQWYKFDTEFEKGSEVEGISLGFAYENDMFYFFRATMELLEALKLAISWEKPSVLVANKNSFAEKALEAVSPGRIEALNLEEGLKFVKHPNITAKKAGQVRKKLGAIFKQGISRNPKGKKTVFIRSNGYLGEVESTLRGEKDLDVVSLDSFLLAKMLNPFNLLSRALSTRGTDRRRFRRLFAALLSKREFREKLGYSGTNFLPVFEMRTGQMTERDWPDFAFAARKLAKLFRRKKPDAVVLWEDFVPFERVCVMLARKFGGKSLVLQHGIFRAVSEKGTWIYGTAPVASDRIGVWGPKFRRILLNHFVPREKIEVLGCPRFDALHNTRFDAKATRERLGIKENEKLVVLATSCTDFSNDEVKQVMEAASSLGARLVVKIHPIDMLDRVSWMREKAVVVQDFPLYELLNGADAVVVKISTVGLEAMVLGKPVAVFGKGLGLENAYEGTDAVLRASDEKGLEKALKIAFGAGKNPVLKQEMADFVQDVAFKQDGMAARRVAGLLERMMAGSST